MVFASIASGLDTALASNIPPNITVLSLLVLSLLVLSLFGLSGLALLPVIVRNFRQQS